MINHNNIFLARKVTLDKLSVNSQTKLNKRINTKYIDSPLLFNKLMMLISNKGF